MKIRIRFTILFGVIVGIILFFFSISIYFLSENYRKEDFYSRLQDRGIAKLKFVLVSDKDSLNPKTQKIQYNPSPSIANERFVIFLKNQTLLYQDSSFKAPDSKVINSIYPDKPFLISTNQTETVGFYYTYLNDSYYIFCSGIDIHGVDYIRNLKRMLFIRGLILIIIIFLSGWLYVGFLLKPISNFIHQVNQINHKNIHQRLGNNPTDDEIGKLASTFNKMLDRLEAAFNSQKRFVANASHELRNPLTAINGQIDVTLMKDRTEEEYKTTLHTISQDVKNLHTLTNNLLELASTDDLVHYHFEEIRIDELIWIVRDDFLRRNPENKVNITFDATIKDDSQLICVGENKLLERAFINIMDNACKFSSNKTVNIFISVQGNDIVICFKDSGIGMPKSYQEHAFEPLYRGENAIGIHGHGIGLSLVHRIIELHKGKVHIESTEGEGTTISLCIPIVKI